MTPASARPLVLLLAALTAFSPMSIDMYLPALPEIGRDLGGSTAATQATMATFLIGLALGQFVYGPLSDRVGRRLPILFGLVVYILATVLCALAPSVEVMLVGRFLQALGCGAGAVISAAVVRDHFDATQTAKVMMSLIMVLGLTPILAPALGSVVMAFGDWRQIFWVMFAVGVAVLLKAYFSLRESRSAETAAQAAHEHPLRSYGLVLRNPRLRGYLLASALASGMFFAYIAASPALLIQVYGYSPQVYSGLFALNALGMIAGAVISSKLVAKLGGDGLLARGVALAVVFALLLFAAALTGIGGRWSVLALLFLTVSTFGVIASNATAGALSTDPLRAGTISALMNGAPFVSAGVTAWLTGVLFDHTARPLAGVMLACISISAAATWLLVMRGQPAHQAAVQA